MINKDTYKRLTKCDENGGIFMCVKTKSKGCTAIAEAQTKILERLAELEDKIMDGTLVQLPCKGEDKVYFIIEKIDYKTLKKYFEILHNTCGAITIDEGGRHCVIVTEDDNDTYYFGDTVFTDKAEAEARLQELQEKTNA